MNRSEVLDTAKEIVTKDRQNQYGDAEDNFKIISKYWSLFLGYPVDPAEVAVMLILLKVARMGANIEYLDNWVDVAGYAACGCEIATKKENDIKIGGSENESE